MCNEAEALQHIRRTLAGEDDRNSFRRSVDPILETPKEQARWRHCP